MSNETSTPSDAPTQRSASDARATYRYLRIGLIVVAVMMAIAVVLERNKVDCWQTSISAYYYTPVRAVFTGGLLAVGFGLIVIKGSTLWEDVCLNLAGMLAPIVALAPTTDVGTCWSIEPLASPKENGIVADWVLATIDNNVPTLLLTGIAGLLIGAVIATIVTKNLTAIAVIGDFGTRVGLTLALSLLTLIYIAYRTWDGFDIRAHGFAAVAMFAFMILAALSAARDRMAAGRRNYALLYYSVCGLMVLAFAVPWALQSNWDHWVLVAEVLEIGLFILFWSVQTAEHWYEEVAPSPTNSVVEA